MPIANSVSLPTHATTYQLSREQVSGQQAVAYRDQALRSLAAAGVSAAVDTDGVVRGVLTIDPRRFKTMPGAPIAPRQAFEVRVPGAIRFRNPSPLSQLGDLTFMEAPSLPRLMEKLIRAWSQRVQLIEASVLAARRLSPNAQLFGDPWRIEGEVSFRDQVIRMMFSTRGDRACVCAIDGCPVDRAPVSRKILPVDAELEPQIWEELLVAAVLQARPCLGPPVVSREERQLSIDLASRDLEHNQPDIVSSRAATTAARSSPPPQRSPRHYSSLPTAPTPRDSSPPTRTPPHGSGVPARTPPNGSGLPARTPPNGMTGGPARTPSGGMGAPAPRAMGNSALTPPRGASTRVPSEGIGAPSRTPSGGTGAPSRTPSGGTGAPSRTPSGGTGAPSRTPSGGTGAPGRTPSGGTGAPSRTPSGGTGAPARTPPSGIGAPGRALSGGTGAPGRALSGGTGAPGRALSGGTARPAARCPAETGAPGRAPSGTLSATSPTPPSGISVPARTPRGGLSATMPTPPGGVSPPARTPPGGTPARTPLEDIGMAALAPGIAPAPSAQRATASVSRGAAPMVSSPRSLVVDDVDVLLSVDLSTGDLP